MSHWNPLRSTYPSKEGRVGPRTLIPGGMPNVSSFNLFVGQPLLLSLSYILAQHSPHFQISSSFLPPPCFPIQGVEEEGGAVEASKWTEMGTLPPICWLKQQLSKREEEKLLPQLNAFWTTIVASLPDSLLPWAIKVWSLLLWQCGSWVLMSVRWIDM